MSSLDRLRTAQDLQAVQVEMVKMCVAEAGYDTGSIVAITDGALVQQGFAFRDMGSRLPVEVCWRARELVGIGEPKCFRCTCRDRGKNDLPPCRSVARHELDCGALVQAGGEAD